jgi:hypothetical protein
MRIVTITYFIDDRLDATVIEGFDHCFHILPIGHKDSANVGGGIEDGLR